MATSLLSPTALRCTAHRDAPTTLRCDECGRPFCRECLTTRWITSRSSIWLCRACARGASGPSAWGPSLGRSSGAGFWLARYWWLLGAIAVMAWLATAH
jgi:hypothetical protein